MPIPAFRVAFIGLGIMGSPMAANLVKAGHTVTGYNRSPHRIRQLVAAGGHAAPSVADAVGDAEVVITMLPADPQVDEVYFGPDGILDHAPAGALLIDMSSVTPQIARRIATAAEANGMRSVDAPVSGGEAGAVEGTLSIMVGGSASDFADALPVLTAMGTTVVLVGPSGCGQTVKAANQLVVAVNIQACAEAVVFLRRSGVDLDAALGVLNGGLAGSTVLTRKRRNLLDRDFAPGFRIDLHHKDMDNLLAAARALDVPLPAASLVAGFITALGEAGDGSLDHSALLLNLERLAEPA